MINSITTAQYNELSNAKSVFGVNTYYRLLKKYTGIKATPYTAYAYWDADGNYLGCSEKDGDDLDDLLRTARISVDKEK